MPPKTLPAFPELKWARAKTPVQGGGKLRRRWVDDKGHIYEWDYRHGVLEKFSKNGEKHLGGFDPNTGRKVQPEEGAKWVEP